MQHFAEPSTAQRIATGPAASGASTRDDLLLQAVADAIGVSYRRKNAGLCAWQSARVSRYIDENLAEKIGIRQLAEVAKLGPSHFSRCFVVTFGAPPHTYLIRKRIERAQSLLADSGDSLLTIALDCGLADQSHLSHLFRRFTGMTPGAWRRLTRAEKQVRTSGSLS